MTRHRLLSVVLLITLYCLGGKSWASNLNPDVILFGEWGAKPGEFGFVIDKDFQFNHSVKFSINNNELYVLDGINNRIQVFTLQGQLKGIVKLSTDWRMDGLAYEFAVLHGMFFIIHGNNPDAGGKIIYKYSADGKLLDKFGQLKLQNWDEGYISLFAHNQSNSLLTNLWPNKIIAYDTSGKTYTPLYQGGKNEVLYISGLTYNNNPIISITNKRTQQEQVVVIDYKSNTIKTRLKLESNFNTQGLNGELYAVKTRSHRRNTPKMPVIDIYNPIVKVINSIEVGNSIRYTKDNTERLLELTCRGTCSESTTIDLNGDIYHLIALSKGVVILKYTAESLKEQISD